MKMMLALCVLDADPQLADPENRKLLRLVLFNSDSEKAEILAAKIARQLTPNSPKPDYLLIREMLMAKAHEIRLSDTFDAKNASGHPLIVHGKEKRADSWCEPKDLVRIDWVLAARHEKVLEDFYRTVGLDPGDDPTNNIIWPLLSKNDPQDTNIRIVFTKTGTDDSKSLAPLMEAVTDDKIIIVYYHHQKDDRRPPIATGALILSDVMQEAGVENAGFSMRMQDIAARKINRKDVGSPWVEAREKRQAARAAHRVSKLLVANKAPPNPSTSRPHGHRLARHGTRHARAG
jgi:hypothetical protein